MATTGVAWQVLCVQLATDAACESSGFMHMSVTTQADIGLFLCRCCGAQEESPEEVERRALSYVAEKKDRDAQEASKTRAAEEAEVRGEELTYLCSMRARVYTGLHAGVTFNSIPALVDSCQVYEP
jgi:hypothetical protein